MRGATLKQARVSTGLTQGALARNLHVSDSSVSDWERGKSPFPRHMARQAIKALRDPTFPLSAAHELLGETFVSPVYNGRRVDRHRASMVAKTMDDFREILARAEAVQRIMFSARGPDDLTPEGRTVLWDWIQAMFRGRGDIDNTTCVLCEAYAFNPEEMFQAHWHEMEARGYYDPRR